MGIFHGFPMEKPSSYWGTPPFMDTSMGKSHRLERLVCHWDSPPAKPPWSKEDFYESTRLVMGGCGSLKHVEPIFRLRIMQNHADRLVDRC